MKVSEMKIFKGQIPQELTCHCGYRIRLGKRNKQYSAVDLYKHIQLDHKDNAVLKWYTLNDCLEITERGKW